MRYQKHTNGGAIFAVIFFLVIQPSYVNGQARRLDQITLPLSVGEVDHSNKEIMVRVDSIRAEKILPIIRTLSSDSFGGRATGSAGYNQAADYVRGCFAQNGLKPIGSSYFQEFKIDTKTIRSRVYLQEETPDSVESMNVIGLKEGTILKDEFVVITAHLDHLGKKGDSIYHGANDNASGVAVMLAVSEALKDLPTRRSVVFVAFAGEEVGLMGSAYMAMRAPIDLKKIRLLVNLDLVGSGKDGIMVQGVDGHEETWSEIQKINEDFFHFELGMRPNSANSDQYYFHRLGVPAFFMYAYNGTIPYHSPADTADQIDAAVIENVAKFVLMNVWKAVSETDE